MGFDPLRQHRPTARQAGARHRFERMFLAAGFVVVISLLLWAFLGGN